MRLLIFFIIAYSGHLSLVSSLALRRRECISFSQWRTRPKWIYNVDIFHERMLHLRDRLGYNPIGVLDVGANVGMWSKEMRKIFPRTNYFMVEAAPYHERKLKETGLPYVIVVLGDGDKETDFFQTPGRRGSTGNSIFREVSEFFSEVQSVKREMRTMDTLVEQQNFTRPYDFLKIDAQGAEIMILKGAPRTLQHINFILLELTLHEFNEGAPLMAVVVQYLDDIGFKPFDTTEWHYFPNGQLFQVDWLFVRKSSKFGSVDVRELTKATKTVRHTS